MKVRCGKLVACHGSTLRMVRLETYKTALSRWQMPHSRYRGSKWLSHQQPCRRSYPALFDWWAYHHSHCTAPGSGQPFYYMAFACCI